MICMWLFHGLLLTNNFVEHSTTGGIVHSKPMTAWSISYAQLLDEKTDVNLLIASKKINLCLSNKTGPLTG